MSEPKEITEQEASEAAVKLAEEYRTKQREDAEVERARNPEKAETEEEFYERVYAVSESSAGFSAPYIRPVADHQEGADVEAERDALFGREEEPAPVQKDDPSEAPQVEETPSTDGTEVVSDDATTIVDTGYTNPTQVETAQGVANALADADAEKNEEPRKFDDIRSEIKAAKTAEEVDSALNGDDRQPLVAAAAKRKKELAK